MNKLLARIEEIRVLKDNWDEEEAPAPSSAAITIASILLGMLLTTNVSKLLINPMRDGGVSIDAFHFGERTIIDIYSDTDIVVVLKAEKGVTSMEFKAKDLVEQFHLLATTHGWSNEPS